MQSTVPNRLTGEFTPVAYLQILFSLLREKKSGLLSIQDSRAHHQFILIDGEIRSSISTNQIPRGKQIVGAGLVSENDLLQAQAKVGDHQSIDESLVEMGFVSHEALVEFESSKLRRSVSQPLGIKNGKWSFEYHPNIDSLRVDSSFWDSPSSLSMLWDGVLDNFSIDLLRTTLPNMDDSFNISSYFANFFSLIEMPEEFSQLPRRLGNGEQISSILDLTNEDNLRGVWFLFHLGLIQTNDQQAATPLSSQSGEKQTLPKAELSDAERKRKLVRVVRSDYRKRMGKDYYGFLGVESGVPKVEVTRAIRRLFRRWRSIKAGFKLDPDSKQKVDTLLKGLSDIQLVFSKEETKRDYDRKLRFGRAPIIGGAERVKGQSSLNDKSLAPIKGMLQRGEYELAIPLLQAACRSKKLSAGVMAALGWCQWNTGQLEKAEDTIFMALQLDPNHLEALEYSARIALEKKKEKKAKKHLLLLLQVKPDHVWARKTVKSLSNGGGA